MASIILDTETTGIDPQKDRLVELAGVADDPLVPHFTTLVNPARDIPPESRAIHHIGPEDVAQAPDESLALYSLMEHFRDQGVEPSEFVAHNAKFDSAFIARIAPALGIPWICTYKASMVAWPDAPAHTNQVLRYYLGLEVDTPPGLFPHRALYDTIVTRAIFKALQRSFSLKELIRISSGPVLLKKVSFGKHKGKLWSEVDYGYLRWCCSQADMNEDVIHTANYYLRKGR